MQTTMYVVCYGGAHMLAFGDPANIAHPYWVAHEVEKASLFKSMTEAILTAQKFHIPSAYYQVKPVAVTAQFSVAS
jgi:hypothetical protein